MGTGGDNAHVLVHDLAIGEGKRSADLSDSSLHVECLSWQGGTWVVLGNVERNPLASLLLVEGEDGQGGGEIGPGGKCSAMDTADVSSVAMEFSGVIVLENDMSDIGIELVLYFLNHLITPDLEDVLGISNLNDGVRVELALEGVRVVRLVNLLDLEEAVLDVVDIVLARLAVGHSEVVDSVVEGVHIVRDL